MYDAQKPLLKAARSKAIQEQRKLLKAVTPYSSSAALWGVRQVTSSVPSALRGAHIIRQNKSVESMF